MTAKKVRPLKPIEVGSRVRHNYVDGHGKGTVLETYMDGDRMKARVKFDNGIGPYSYLYALPFPEIMPI